MQIDRKIALGIWTEMFGKAIETQDAAGRTINKSAYNQVNSKYGWTVTRIVPATAGGSDKLHNLMCMHVLTVEEKGESYPVFKANDKRYAIVTDENGAVGIEPACDSESIAEQEAMTAAAMEKWDELFGEDCERASDFCGRIIHKSEYGTDSEYAWKVAKYVKDKPSEYIANVATVEEVLGRNAFTANGKAYALNKENGRYFFKYNKPKDEYLPAIEPSAPEYPDPIPEPAAEPVAEPTAAEPTAEPAAEPIPEVEPAAEQAAEPEPEIIRELSIKPKFQKGITLRLKKPEPEIIRELSIKPKFQKGITLRLKKPEPEIIRELSIKPKFQKGITLRLKKPEPEIIRVEAPKPKEFNVMDPYDVAVTIQNNVTEAMSADENAMVDFIVIRTVTRPGCPASFAKAIIDTVSTVLKGGAGEWLGMENSDMIDAQGARHMVLVYRFLTPSPADFGRIFGAAKILNTYSSLLLQTLGVEQLKIFNYATFVNRTQLYHPVSLLTAYNPELKAFMDSVYAGAYDNYCFGVTTLFVSRFIVFNVPELRDAHPEGIAEFLPPVGMIEHNEIDFTVSMALSEMLSGASARAKAEAAKAEAAKAAEAEKSEAAEPETEDAPIAPVTAETDTEAEPEAKPEEIPEPEAEEAQIAPVTVETDTKAEPEEIPEPKTEDAPIAPVTAETDTEAEAEAEPEEIPEPEAEEAQIAPVAEKKEADGGMAGILANTLAGALASVPEPETETKPEPETPAVDVADAMAATLAASFAEAEELPSKTPEGEQIKLDIGEVDPESDSDDGDMFTLDLDSID